MPTTTVDNNNLTAISDDCFLITRAPEKNNRTFVMQTNYMRQVRQSAKFLSRTLFRPTVPIYWSRDNIIDIVSVILLDDYVVRIELHVRPTTTTNLEQSASPLSLITRPTDNCAESAGDFNAFPHRGSPPPQTSLAVYGRSFVRRRTAARDNVSL